MRMTASVLVGLLGLAAASVPASAVPSLAPVPEARSMLTEAGVRCGPGAHYVRGHHARNGAWIPGHCVPNR